MTKRIILHIGGVKCGSSTIQKTLTFNPTLSYSGDTPGPIHYWLLINGVATKSPHVDTLPRGADYLSSNYFPSTGPDQPCIHLALSDLVNKMEDGEVAILSSEDYGHQIVGIAESAEVICNCLARNDLEIIAVLFIRNPISLIESAYYQWGVWEKPTLESWMEDDWTNLTFLHGQMVQSALKVGCDKVVVHHLEQGNLLEPFSKILSEWGYSSNLLGKIELLNSNLRASLDDIRLELRNSGLRKIHDPEVEFLLSQLRLESKLPFVKPPNLISETVVSTIISRASKDCELLRTFCSEETNAILALEFSEEKKASLIQNPLDGDPYSILHEPPSAEYLEQLSALTLRKILNKRSAQAERNQAVAERNQAVAERELIASSHIWRYTKKYRKLRGILKSSKSA
jgi:hypothetical protein